MSLSTPTKHDGRAVLFAVAELLVIIGHELVLQANFLTLRFIKQKPSNDCVCNGATWIRETV